MPAGGEVELGRLFFAFPAGFPGIALLFLRAVTGLAVAIHSICYFRDSGAASAGTLVGFAAVLLSALLVVGLLTPISGLLIVAGALAIHFAWLPDCAGEVADSGITVLLRVAVLVAIVGLGPGAFSLDARLFGRREIIIPPSSGAQR
jgi:uncharacterized membrane protein YphA (DoxX/SURF4 family)